ncbi:MAG: acetate--CoA ligase family protein [Candidatus Bathyarchaeota archaeon]|nr:acetate--CoA ligase family protein [Candidatus Bathyarchaeota archaeon]
MTVSAKVNKIFQDAKAEGRNFLLEHEAKSVCKEYGIPITELKIAKTAQEAAKFSEEIGYPTVLKIISPDVIHKFDVGGVVLDVNSKEDAINGFKQIVQSVKKHNSNAKIDGILVQEMAPCSTEVIVGAIKDAQFGPTLMFGLGGTFVEVMKDVSFRIAPIDEQEAKEMISEVKAYPILQGIRGQAPKDINAITKILLSTSKLVMDYPEIKELDLNPVMVYEKGAKTVDARIILE